MNLEFGREICSNLDIAERREWLITNGIGGYASGTVSRLLTRCYHGLLLAALNPPLGLTLLLTKLDATAVYDNTSYPLCTNRWANNVISPDGYKQEKFYLEGTTPVWIYACADALIEKRIWMQQGENTTYIQYKMLQGTQPLTLYLKALVNYRHRHGNTRNSDLPFEVVTYDRGIKVTAFEDASDLYLSGVKNDTDTVTWEIEHQWYRDFALAMEKYQGLNDLEDHLHAGTCSVTLKPGESITIIASTEEEWTRGLGDEETGRQRKKELIDLFNNSKLETIPSWIEQLVLAADQFIVDRPLKDVPDGKTIIAGYPWFGD